MFTRIVFVFAAVAISVSAAPTADEPKSPTEDEIKAAQERLTEFLKDIKGASYARVTAMTGEGIGMMFPDHVLFSVLFPQYPVGRPAPAPLKVANVISIPKKKDGKPITITTHKELETFFKDAAHPVKNAEEGEAAMKAWLWAAAALAQDGFYKFSVKLDDKMKVDGTTCTGSGQAPVDPQGGNKGEIKATLTFKDGKLASADTKVDLKPGVRPICQATKLLDPDPIVRGMAEQSIRVMGSAAKPYLDEQRAKANAQLREAIDRIWAKIVEEGR
jgi:hypothetical protein